ncbi:MAG: hypothetical protein V4655_11190 [Bdellovibrionota bacterium]
MMTKRLPSLLPFLLAAAEAHADPKSFDTSFEGSPFLSARAAGLGETLSTTATALDAFYYNPALIGGVHDKTEKPFLTHLYFPYLGMAAGDGGSSLVTERLQGTALSDDVMADKLSSTFSGSNPYGRISATPVVVFNRLMAGYTINKRVSAVLDETDPAAPRLHLTETSASGPIVGFSATAPKEEFYLGVSVAFMQIEQTDASFTQAEFADAAVRKAAIKEGKDKFEGMPIHIGSAYRFKHSLKPAISFVMQDLGTTRYSRKDKSLDPRLQKENALIGFSLSPKIQDWAMVNVTTEFANLTDSSVKFADKFRASTEFTMGERFGADAGFSARLGYTTAGMSYGLGMNLGILHAEIASLAEDIGIDDSKVIERKSVFNIGINIADY